MSADTTSAAVVPGQSPQSVQLFQRAHQKMVMLQRVDDQIQTLLNQRRSIQDELRGIQAQINDEFDKLLKAGNGTTTGPTRLLAEIADDFKRSNGSTDREAVRVEVGD
jgi:hypothetical protein